MITIRLPIPPSVNQAYRNVPGKGRVKTASYKVWETEAGWALKSQRPASITGPVGVVIELERQSARSDVDNRIKLVLDLLTAHKVIDDDRFVQEITARWADIDGCIVTVGKHESEG